MGQIEGFLHKVNDIRVNYESNVKKDAINYNIFEALNLEAKEDTLHTRILFDFLNPFGLHGQGEVFLNAFIEIVKDNLNGIFSDFGKPKVERERNIGQIVDMSYDDGGNIDLIIFNNNREAIIIENKIYAIDQPNQLHRYYRYGIKEFGEKRFKLFYLTLNGKKCSNYNFQDNYVCISYQDHILNWLEKCLIICNDKPNLKEVLKQYKHTIEKLTGKKELNQMEKEIIELLKDEDHFKLALGIKTNYERMLSILERKIRDLHRLLEQQYDNTSIRINNCGADEGTPMFTIDIPNSEAINSIIEIIIDGNNIDYYCNDTYYNDVLFLKPKEARVNCKYDCNVDELAQEIIEFIDKIALQVVSEKG